MSDQLITVRVTVNGTEYEREVEPGLRWEGDPMRLAQVVSNLLTNAARYTEPGGAVALCAGRDGPGWLRIGVSDNGIGLAPEMLTQVFGLFFQGKRSVDRTLVFQRDTPCNDRSRVPRRARTLDVETHVVLEQAGGHLDRVVDHDVEAAERLHAFGHRALHLIPVRKVGLDGIGLDAPPVADFGGAPFASTALADMGPGTFNAGSCYYINYTLSAAGDLICQTGGQFTFQTTSDNIILSSAGAGSGRVAR